MDETAASELELPRNARALLDAVVAISSDLDMRSVLNRIVVSACEITGARYGALGVLGNTSGLVDFITAGLSEDEHRAIGDLPRGHGILGLLIDRPEPLRLKDLNRHPQSYGFPANHPPMQSFLGVPVRTRGTVFGNLYLTEKVGGAEFTEQDEMLLDVLATAAGFVIENARAFAQSERRRQWLEASARISEALQPPIRLDDALHRIAFSARRVSRASAVAIVQRTNEEVHEISALESDPESGAEQMGGLLSTLEKHMVRAETEADVVVVPQGSGRTVVLVPFRAHLAAKGVLLILLDGGRGSLEPEEAELLASFADQASLALDRAQAIADRQELMLISDRDRIARDLHDLVIQRLFATGLQLQGARRSTGSGEVRDRIDSAVADLDVTIRDIRSTIFELQHSHEVSLRADIRAVAQEYVPVLGFTPTVRTSGPIDTAVPQRIGEQMLAVLREALSNVARHAKAGTAVIEVEAVDAHVVLRVIDDGSGLPAERHESGLRNVRRRAHDFDGVLRLLPQQPTGTALEWTVPLAATAPWG